MALTSTRPQLGQDDLEGARREPDASGAAVAPRRVRTATRPRRLAIGLAFAFGLLLGWLAIGWWLWPVEWTSSAPWQLRPGYQKTYVALVAEEYSRTSDLSQVEAALAGWSKQDLARLLAELQAETTDPDRRAHQTALAAVLAVPTIQTPLLDSLLSQNGILIGVALAAAPLLAALALVILPRLRAPAPEQEVMLEDATDFEAQPEPPLDELIEDVVIGEQLDEEADQAAEATSADGRRPVQEKEGDEQDPEQVREQEGEESGAVLGDLTSLFEEEDTSLTTLEAMVKDLPEFSVDDLFKSTNQVVDQLRKGAPKRADDQRIGIDQPE
jgi:hypothetical protein